MYYVVVLCINLHIFLIQKKKKQNMLICQILCIVFSCLNREKQNVVVASSIGEPD